MKKNNEWKILNKEMKIKYNKIKKSKDSLRNIPKNLYIYYDFFKLYFDDDYISQIVKNSNEYLKLKKNKNNEEKHARALRCGEIIFEKIEKYLPCEILMGIIKMPSYKDYWENDDIFKNSNKSIMSLYMYENINTFIHPEDANLKESNKILNSIKNIIEKSQKYY